MPTSRHTTTVEFDDELWELVEAEAAHAGVSVSQYVRDAVIARIVVGPVDSRVFEVLATGVRQALHNEREPARRREAERSLGVLARMSAARRRQEARAVRAQSAQVIRMGGRGREDEGPPPPLPEPLTGPGALFRINPDWTEVRTVESPHAIAGPNVPDPTWLQDERVHPDDRQRVQAVLVQAIATREVFEVQYRVLVGDTARFVHLRALPLLTTAGVITEWIAVATDVTDAAG